MESEAESRLTGHVHHPAVAVLHDVASLAVDPAGGHAVGLEKPRLQSPPLALSPRGRQVGQLQERQDDAWGYLGAWRYARKR